MSSGGEDHNDDSLGTKKRRIQRACDICRRKKIRCDGPNIPGNRCTNCVTWSFDCTYVEPAVVKKRGFPKGYVERLESRVEKLENALRILCPDDNVLTELGVTLEGPSERAFGKPHQSNDDARSPRLSYDIAASAISKVNNPDDPRDDQDDDVVNAVLLDNLKRLEIGNPDSRFFGKSSGAMLVQTAMELKSEYTGSDYVQPAPSMNLENKRPEFWSCNPWEREVESQPQTLTYVFPEDGLVIQLVDLYFTHFNLYQPLLHRPTFEKSIADKLHFTNNGFAVTLLVVCANGSRYSEDPRVFLNGTGSHHSRGWKWFDQVQMIRKSLLAVPSIYDMQFYCLSVQFLQDSSAPQSCWTLVGIGIRLAQEVGAHKRKARDHPLTVEDELWKRAFWILVCMDRAFSSSLGRSCAIQEEDFDLDMPIECDDEYWEHPDPSQCFKQLANKASLITQFNLYLKLNQILSFALRTIYSINKSKNLLGFVGPNWEQNIVAELDSALNKWVGSVPDHLRWDPHREDIKFFNQSVVLYSAYYHTQILVHRPFIPSPSKPSLLPFPSLAICTNAARACSHIIDIQRKRDRSPSSLAQMPVFTSGIVLLLSIWGAKRSGLSTDPNKEMVDVHKCMRMLRASESRWHSAGRLWDILCELATMGDFPLPQPSPPMTNKRRRYSESSTVGEPTYDAMLSVGTVRDMAGSRRVSGNASTPISLPLLPQQIFAAGEQQEQPIRLQHPSNLQEQPPSPRQFFALPMCSNDLARLPDDYGQTTFSTIRQSSGDHQTHWYPPSAGGQYVSGGVNPLTNFSAFTPSCTASGSSPGSDLTGMGSGVQGMLAAGPEDMARHYPMSLSSSRSPEGPSAGSSTTLMGDSISVDSVYRESQFGGSGMSRLHLHTPLVSGSLLHVEQQQSQYPEVDQDMLSMWSTLPSGFELDEWGNYLLSVGELTQGSGIFHGHSASRG